MITRLSGLLRRPLARPLRVPLVFAPRLVATAAAPPPSPPPPAANERAEADAEQAFEQALAQMDAGRVGDAIDGFASAARAGSAGANFFLGLAYDGLLGENALGEPHVEVDPSAAARCYQRAAEAGHAEAMLNLSLCFRNGEGVDRSARAAFQWTERGAAAGCERSMFNAGVALDPLHPPWGSPGAAEADLQPISKDGKRAAGYYRDAVDAGHAKAMVNLSILLYTGTGVEKDAAAAAELWRAALEEGVQQADFCLKNMEERPGELTNMFENHQQS